MPATYVEWKENVATVIRLYGKNLAGNVLTSMVFHPTHITLRVQETEKKRFGRADIDNLIGGVMDAMQDSGVIADDKHVVWVEGVFTQDGGT
jgi:Holliday junction resolvase RusA-like endonuclease